MTTPELIKHLRDRADGTAHHIVYMDWTSDETHERYVEIQMRENVPARSGYKRRFCAISCRVDDIADMDVAAADRLYDSLVEGIERTAPERLG